MCGVEFCSGIFFSPLLTHCSPYFQHNSPSDQRKRDQPDDSSSQRELLRWTIACHNNNRSESDENEFSADNSLWHHRRFVNSRIYTCDPCYHLLMRIGFLLDVSRVPFVCKHFLPDAFFGRLQRRSFIFFDVVRWLVEKKGLQRETSSLNADKISLLLIV